MAAVNMERPSRYQMLSPHPPKLQEEERGEITGLRYVSFIKNLPHELATNNNEASGPHRHPRSPPPPTPKSPASATPLKQKSHNPLKEVQDIKKKNEEMHAKKLKEIEECKYECKQTDRILKRVEGDIIQRGEKLRKLMKEYETDVYRKQRKEEENLISASLEERSVKQKSAMEDVKLTKDRIHRNTVNLQKEKETDSKISNTMNQIEQRYTNVAEAIRLKRLQMSSLVKEFEQRVQQEEEEEHRLKKEFANLTLELNMKAKMKNEEASRANTNARETDQKDRSDTLQRTQQRAESVAVHEKEGLRSIAGGRRLSVEKDHLMNSLKLKGREDGRKLRDVKVKIRDNSVTKKQVQTKAELLERERLGAQSKEKVLAVSANRKLIRDLITRERKQKNDLSLDQWRQRNFKVSHADKLHSMQDNISHFQKTVTKQEDNEQYLYHQVRKIDNEHKKQEQTVDLVRSELWKLQKQNKMLLLETEKRCAIQEEELKERLRREEAQLGKALAEREEKIQSLNKCRSSLSEDQHMLKEEQKVRDRLLKIEEKSNLLRTSDAQDV